MKSPGFACTTNAALADFLFVFHWEDCLICSFYIPVANLRQVDVCAIHVTGLMTCLGSGCCPGPF